MVAMGRLTKNSQENLRLFSGFVLLGYYLLLKGNKSGESLL
jgi:hypothetical protein